MNEPRQLAVKILHRIDATDAFADIVLDHFFADIYIVERDKRLIHEIVHGVIRWRKRIDWIIRSFFKGDFEKSPHHIKNILRISIYQLLFLERIPDYAVINEGVKLARKLKGDFWAKKTNAILRNFLRHNDDVAYPPRDTKPIQYLAVRYSHPEWMVARWVDRFGPDATEKLCISNNYSPKISLRVNRTKTTAAKLQQLLAEHDVRTEPAYYLPEFLKSDNMPDLKKFDPFIKGLFSIQDESAGLVAHLVEPQQAELIIDICAAPGGKTTHIAELSSDNCRIIAADIHFNRLLLIRNSIERLGLSSVHLLNIDSTRFFNLKADRVLVDAPCSGLGVLSKRSDLRWKRSAEQINKIVRLQQRILDAAGHLVKTGGYLIYSTCTIEPEENEQQITKFLEYNQNFKFDFPAEMFDSELVSDDKYLYTFPHIHQTDGAFATRLLKTG